MVKYFMSVEGEDLWRKSGEYLYGISAYKEIEGVICVIKSVSRVSNEVNRVKEVVDKLNRNDVDPVHLEEIIEDEMCFGK